MKLNKFRIFTLSAILLGMSGCSSEDCGIFSDNGKIVEVPISVSINLGGGDTRTILTEADNTLKWQWDSEKEEQILVTNQEGERVSILTLDEIVPNTNNKTATFSGLISLKQGVTGTANYNFYYAGDGVDVSDISGSHKIVLSKQSGKLEDLQKLDVLSASKEISINNTLIEVSDLQMSHRLSAGKFHFTFPEDFEPSSLYLWGDGIKSSVSISLAGAMPMTDTSRATRAITFPGDDDDYVFGGSASATVIVLPSNTITIAKDNLGNILSNDIYLMLAPSLSEEDLVDMEFVAFDKDNNKCVGKFYKDNNVITPFNLPSGKFLCLSNGNALPVQMKLEGDDDENQEEVQDDEVVGPVFQINDRDGNTINVRFTRANLHYNTSDEKWYIPEKQTDYVNVAGKAVGYNTKWTIKSEIDLFRWGATGYSDYNKTVVSPVMEKDVAWRTMTGVYWPYKNKTGQSIENANPSNIKMRTQEHKYTDWGWILGYQKNGSSSSEFEDEYFTLTGNEWEGIVNTYVHYCATVAGVKGMLLLPCTSIEDAKKLLQDNDIDTQHTAHRIDVNYFSSHQTSFLWSNIYIAEYDKLKDLNAVFFPAAGSKKQTASSETKDEVDYWQSETSQTNAYHLWIRTTETSTSANLILNSYASSAKCDARAVRLVKKVKTLSDSEVVQ